MDMIYTTKAWRVEVVTDPEVIKTVGAKARDRGVADEMLRGFRARYLNRRGWGVIPPRLVMDPTPWGWLQWSRGEW
jgi:hypothetical protein